MKSLKKLILLIIFSLLFTSCYEENEYKAIFFFPEAKSDGIALKFLTSYALNEKGYKIDANDLLETYDELQNKMFGGVGVGGIITIKKDYVIYEPDFGSSLLVSGFNSFKIPMSDIKNAKSESFMLIGKAVVIETVNGSFKFQLQYQKHWYNPIEFSDEEICEKINSQIN